MVRSVFVCFHVPIWLENLPAWAETGSITTSDQLGCIAQLVARLTQEPEVPDSIPGLATYFVSPSADSRRAVVSFWEKCVHEVLVNRLGGLSLPRKSVVRLNDCPDMTLDVYRGLKTTTQQQQQIHRTILCKPCIAVTAGFEVLLASAAFSSSLLFFSCLSSKSLSLSSLYTRPFSSFSSYKYFKDSDMHCLSSHHRTLMQHPWNLYKTSMVFVQISVLNKSSFSFI